MSIPSETNTMNILLDTGTHKIETSGVASNVTDKLITRLAFKKRMTDAERIAVRGAAAVNDTIYDFMDLLSDATYVDLEDPETVAGVGALEGAGLLGAGRASEILTGAIQDIERP